MESRSVSPPSFPLPNHFPFPGGHRPPPPPPLAPVSSGREPRRRQQQGGVFREVLLVGPGRYDTVVTNDVEVAAAWVRGLPLLDPSPPVPRIVGFSCRWSAAAGGPRRLDSIHLSFFSRVLVLHLGEGTLFPEALAGFFESDRNLFVGGGVGEAAEMLGRDHGVRLGWGMDLGPAAALCCAERGDRGLAHVVLARRLLGWPEGLLLRGIGGRPWTAWPLSGEQVEFAVQSCVLSQLIGHYAAQWRSIVPVRENCTWLG